LESRGFPPVATRDARVLILGTLPGPESLRQQQYYALPRNAFWRIMGDLFGAGPGESYPRRLKILKHKKDFRQCWRWLTTCHPVGIAAIRLPAIRIKNR